MTTLSIETDSKKFHTPTQKDRLSVFFENHSTTRKLAAYIPPIYFGTGAVLKQMTSYNILPRLSPLSVLVFIPIWFLSLVAMDCERSLHNKQVEPL
jgi:hypothetical protein